MPATNTDLNASTAATLAAFLKTQLDRALADFDRQFGGFRVSMDTMDGGGATMFVRVRAIATKDTMINAAGIMARRVCAQHTYNGKPFYVQCIAGESHPRYF